jgi:hypothetical protein
MTSGGFFDDLAEEPPPEPEPRYRSPNWLTPPENVRPATIALDAVLFQDGRRALWVDAARVYPQGLLPTLVPRGGGGVGAYHYEFWLWPLAPRGPLSFVFAWPALGIPESRATVATEPILGAASRATELWPEDRPLWADRA